MTAPPVTSDTLKRWHGRIEQLLNSIVREAESMRDCRQDTTSSLMFLVDAYATGVLKEIHAAYIDALRIEAQ